MSRIVRFASVIAIVNAVVTKEVVEQQDEGSTDQNGSSSSGSADVQVETQTFQHGKSTDNISGIHDKIAIFDRKFVAVTPEKIDTPYMHLVGGNDPEETTFAHVSPGSHKRRFLSDGTDAIILSNAESDAKRRKMQEDDDAKQCSENGVTVVLVERKPEDVLQNVKTKAEDLKITINRRALKPEDSTSSIEVDTPTRKANYLRVGKGEGRGEPMFIPDDWSFQKNHFLLPKHYADSLKSIMLPKGMINDRTEKIATEIRKQYGDAEVHILCVLKGSRGFFNELLKIFDRIHKYSVQEGYRKAPYMEHYVKLKSYSGMQSTGNLQVISDDLSVLKGKDVLIVEDIIDTGSTLKKFCKHLEDFEPKSIKVASLLEKRTPKSCGFKGDFVGFSVPDEFIVGYCLDYNEHFRDLDHVCVMNESGIAKYSEK